MRASVLLFSILLLACRKESTGTALATPDLSLPPLGVASKSSARPASRAAYDALSAPVGAKMPFYNPRGCIVLDEETFADGLPVTLEGKLFVDPDFYHPTHGPTRPYILALTKRRCVLNGGELTEVAEVHLAPDQAELGPLVGQNVRVVDGRPFAGHTAWHARPIVVMTDTAIVLP
jgi:hypothetical protein